MTEIKLPKIGGIPFSSPEELAPDQFQDKAKAIVREHVDTSLPMIGDGTYTVYVVWFAKVLQNWKAVLSTSRPDGRIYEVTYNGDKLESYLDAYVKEINMVITDRPKPRNTNIQGDS